MGMKGFARPIPGTENFRRDTPAWYRRFGASWWHDFSSFLFWRVNWSDFTLIELAGELAWNMGTGEFKMALLGFHVQFTYYWSSDERDSLGTMARLAEAGFIETVSLDDIDAATAAVADGDA